MYTVHQSDESHKRLPQDARNLQFRRPIFTLQKSELRVLAGRTPATFRNKKQQLTTKQDFACGSVILTDV